MFGGLLVGDAPPRAHQLGALVGEVGAHVELPQLAGPRQLERAAVATRALHSVEALSLDPDLDVFPPCEVADEGQVALIDLGQEPVGRPRDVDPRLEPVVAGDLSQHV